MNSTAELAYLYVDADQKRQQLEAALVKMKEEFEALKKELEGLKVAPDKT